MTATGALRRMAHVSVWWFGLLQHRSEDIPGSMLPHASEPHASDRCPATAMCCGRITQRDKSKVRRKSHNRDLITCKN
jgi:hypothetical protein